MSDNLRQLQCRIDALRPHRDATIPAGRCILYRPLDRPYSELSPGTWTDDPPTTWAVQWRRVEWIWELAVIPPGMLGSLESAVATLETIAEWMTERQTK